MIDQIITSKTRIKLLMKFFLNSDNRSYLRSLEKDFGESTNAIRLELNRFIEADLLRSETEGNKRYYRANTQHPLFKDINNILRKTVGIDKIINRIASRIGDLEKAYITGSFAEGVNSEIIELVLVGNHLDTGFIDNLVKKAEKRIGRKIMYLNFTPSQMEYFFKNKATLLIWEKDRQTPGREESIQ